MANRDIFNEPAKMLPKRDAQIVRVPFTESEIGARKDHMPAADSSAAMGIQHVPNAGSKT